MKSGHTQLATTTRPKCVKLHDLMTLRENSFIVKFGTRPVFILRRGNNKLFRDDLTLYFKMNLFTKTAA